MGKDPLLKEESGFIKNCFHAGRKCQKRRMDKTVLCVARDKYAEYFFAKPIDKLRLVGYDRNIKKKEFAFMLHVSFTARYYAYRGLIGAGCLCYADKKR